jgi:hypothetical protein
MFKMNHDLDKMPLPQSSRNQELEAMLKLFSDKLGLDVNGKSYYEFRRNKKR